VLDVHPPHEPVHGWRDFLLHILTITIGLLIALGLEGCVEWQHHRHLVHEAEASLHAEIESNAKGLQDVLNDVHKQQANLKNDVAVLDDMIKTPKSHKHQSMSIAFRINKFDDVSWKTAQSTGALSYMSYDTAQKYASIYSLQEELEKAQMQGSRDAILSIGPVMNTSDSEDLTPEDARSMKDHIEVVQGSCC
jgi:ribosomal protein RSM22 (predicted rRNA methylase)